MSNLSFNKVLEDNIWFNYNGTLVNNSCSSLGYRNYWI